MFLIPIFYLQPRLGCVETIRILLHMVIDSKLTDNVEEAVT